MKTRIVYTIISSGHDNYLEQLIMSVYSLLKYNSKAEITVITDKNTVNSFIGWRSCIKNMVNQIKVVNIPEKYNQMQCSRFLKTNLRKFIKGDYLYIDTDTIICDSLQDIDFLNADIALVADCNGNLNLEEESVIEKCNKAGFDNMKGQNYFNSGVMFVRDTPVSHYLYDEWFKQWEYSVSRGVNFDQPSMNYANILSNNPIKELSGEWNCQFFFKGWNYLPKAKILHYAGGGNSTKMNYLYNLIKTKGIKCLRIKYYFIQPKISFYGYLSGMSSNLKTMILLSLYIHFKFIYNLILRKYEKQ